MAIWRQLLAIQRFLSPPLCIFAKLVTKVAKRSAANVVLLQRGDAALVGQDWERKASGEAPARSVSDLP
jgi:hypothetical protein